MGMLGGTAATLPHLLSPWVAGHPQHGRSPGSPRFGRSPILPPPGLLMSGSPEIYVARGAEKPRNLFSSEPGVSLGHPIILHRRRQHQGVATPGTGGLSEVARQAHTGSPEEKAPERRGWILTVTPQAP